MDPNENNSDWTLLTPEECAELLSEKEEAQVEEQELLASRELPKVPADLYDEFFRGL